MKTVDQKTSSRSLWKRMWRHRVSYLMILPPIVTVFIFHYIPIYGVQIAFKDFSSRLGIWGSKWVGLKHFRAFVNHPFFSQDYVEHFLAERGVTYFLALFYHFRNPLE